MALGAMKVCLIFYYHKIISAFLDNLLIAIILRKLRKIYQPVSLEDLVLYWVYSMLDSKGLGQG